MGEDNYDDEVSEDVRYFFTIITLIRLGFSYRFRSWGKGY